MLRHILLVSILFCAGAMPAKAEELFFDAGAWGVGEERLEKSFCLPNKREEKFCMLESLTYPATERSTLPYATELPRRIHPFLKEYRAVDLRKELYNTLKDMEPAMTGEWYEKRSVALFAQTSSTYTLIVNSSGYTGGAHGFFSTAFLNYTPGGEKALTLSDLFIRDSKRTLRRIAERYYRHSVGLSSHASLTREGWFENRFTLAREFAITPRGLLFVYNQYEIKPYAAGQTSLMLPYALVRPLIDPKGPLAFALRPSRKLEAHFIVPDKVRLDIHGRRRNDGFWELDLHARRLAGSEAHGWLSLSFPDLPRASRLSTAGSEGFDSIHSYPAGSRLYHKALHQRVDGRYLLVEGVTTRWKEDENKHLHLRVKFPASITFPRLYLRVTFKNSDGKLESYPPEYEGIEGEQGFKNWEVVLVR